MFYKQSCFPKTIYPSVKEKNLSEYNRILSVKWSPDQLAIKTYYHKIRRGYHFTTTDTGKNIKNAYFKPYRPSVPKGIYLNREKFVLFSSSPQEYGLSLQLLSLQLLIILTAPFYQKSLLFSLFPSFPHIYGQKNNVCHFLSLQPLLSLLQGLSPTEALVTFNIDRIQPGFLFTDFFFLGGGMPPNKDIILQKVT